MENEILKKEVDERQQLLCEASKALELQDEEKINDLRRSEIMIDELNHKIEALNSEIASLQAVNKSGQSNDTGYADCAVNSKDIEYQQKLLELNQTERTFNKKMSEMNEMIKMLQGDKLTIEAKASQLLYENDEMKDKLANVERSCNEQVRSRRHFYVSFQPFLRSQHKRFKLLKDLSNQKFLEYEVSRQEYDRRLKGMTALQEQFDEREYANFAMFVRNEKQHEQPVSARFARFFDKILSRNIKASNQS